MNAAQFRKQVRLVERIIALYGEGAIYSCAIGGNASIHVDNREAFNRIAAGRRVSQSIVADWIKESVTIEGIELWSPLESTLLCESRIAEGELIPLSDSEIDTPRISIDGQAVNLDTGEVPLCDLDADAQLYADGVGQFVSNQRSETDDAYRRQT